MTIETSLASFITKACPLVGDTTYGAAAAASRAPAEFRELLRAFPRPALHATVLGLTHPVTGAAMRFDEPWPDDLEALRDRLRRIVTGAQKGHSS